MELINKFSEYDIILQILIILAILLIVLIFLNIVRNTNNSENFESKQSSFRDFDNNKKGKTQCILVPLTTTTLPSSNDTITITIQQRTAG